MYNSTLAADRRTHSIRYWGGLHEFISQALVLEVGSGGPVRCSVQVPTYDDGVIQWCCCCFEDQTHVCFLNHVQLGHWEDVTIVEIRQVDSCIGNANIVLQSQPGRCLFTCAEGLDAVRERLQEKLVGAEIRVVVKPFRAFESDIAGTFVASPDTILSRRRRETRKPRMKKGEKND